MSVSAATTPAHKWPEQTDKPPNMFGGLYVCPVRTGWGYMAASGSLPDQSWPQ